MLFEGAGSKYSRHQYCKPASVRQLIFRGLRKDQSLPIIVCVWVLKPCRPEVRTLISLPSGLIFSCRGPVIISRCPARWHSSWQLQDRRAAPGSGNRNRTKWWKQCLTSVMAIARPYASLRSQRHIFLSPFHWGETEAQRDFCKLYQLTETEE